MERIVIVGAGQAAVQAVATLRTQGFGGSITLVGEEPIAPYQRPPLSKAYLSRTMEHDRLFLKPAVFYREAECETLFGVAATRIDRGAKRIYLADGRDISYDKLLLTTGSRARRLALPGGDLPDVCYLRSIADVDSIQARMVPDAKLAIVGAGYIGLEVAAVARKLGHEVRVFEALDRVMARAVSPPLSQFYMDVHAEAGVHFHLGQPVEGFEGRGRLEAIVAGGARYPADIAVVGVGILPNVELAEDAGLACNDGILVDAHCASTTDPAIFAAGDCTQHTGRDGRSIRLECVQNAIDQAKHAAMAMCGRPSRYSEVPWFWSDQYDLKLQIAGLAWVGDGLVIRGNPEARKFSVFHLREGRVAAVEAVNAAADYLGGRKLIAEGVAVSPDRLADPAIPMKNVA